MLNFKKLLIVNLRTGLKKILEERVSLQSNDFWFNVLMDARQHNLSIERITNVDVILKSISLNDIAKLANYYFDEKYTRTVQLLAE